MNIAREVRQGAEALGKEVVVQQLAEEGRDWMRDLFSGQEQEGETTPHSFLLKLWNDFLSGFVPNLTSSAQHDYASTQAAFGVWLTQSQGYDETEVSRELDGFGTFMERVHATEAWRVNLFKNAVARNPSSSQRILMIWYIFDAPDDDERLRRLRNFISEKPALTRFGLWLKEKGFANWQAIVEAIRKFLTETLPELLGRIDGYLDEHVAPQLEETSARWCGQMDAFAARVEQRGGKITNKWYLPF